VSKAIFESLYLYEKTNVFCFRCFHGEGCVARVAPRQVMGVRDPLHPMHERVSLGRNDRVQGPALGNSRRGEQLDFMDVKRIKL
jgi:hypothetical protein